MPGFELIGSQEKKAVGEVFDKGGVLYRYGLDQKRQGVYRVDEFEKAIARKVKMKYCHCVCNGTAALKIALVGIGVKEGNEVITQSFTFIATVEAILELGAKPVITEVNDTLNMDPADLQKKITKKTKAIIPVHMAGVPAEMREIMAIANRYHIPVIEDSAQAFGASYKGKYLGTIGKAGIYSFDIGKVIATGEGGALVTNVREIYLRAREYADHGHEQNPSVPRGEDTRRFWGFNYKMMELQGAVGLAQLKKLDFILQKQREWKKKMKGGLKNIAGITFRRIPDPLGDAGDTFIFFVESQKKAQKIAKLLSKEGIGTKNLPDAIDWHFAGTWKHIFSPYAEYKGKDLTKVWKNSNDLLRRAIAIPIFVNMNDKEITRIVTRITRVVQKV